MSQRKIKIWDLEYKEWISPKDFINYLWGAKHTKQELILDDDVQEGYKVLMFTGLTDKNGKEIYEGDVIKFVGSVTPSVVGFEYGAFCHLLNNKYYSWLGGTHQKNMEILGNIFENPDLI